MVAPSGLSAGRWSIHGPSVTWRRSVPSAAIVNRLQCPEGGLPAGDSSRIGPRSPSLAEFEVNAIRSPWRPNVPWRAPESVGVSGTGSARSVGESQSRGCASGGPPQNVTFSPAGWMHACMYAPSPCEIWIVSPSGLHAQMSLRMVTILAHAAATPIERADSQIASDTGCRRTRRVRERRATT